MHAAASPARELGHRSMAARWRRAHAREKAHIGEWAYDGAGHLPLLPWTATGLCLPLCGAGRKEEREKEARWRGTAPSCPRRRHAPPTTAQWLLPLGWGRKGNPRVSVEKPIGCLIHREGRTAVHRDERPAAPSFSGPASGPGGCGPKQLLGRAASPRAGDFEPRAEARRTSSRPRADYLLLGREFGNAQ